MKKMVSFISALAMCAVMAAPMASSAAGEGDVQSTTQASATTINGEDVPVTSLPNEKSATASADFEEKYTVIIPDTLTDKTENFTIEASDVRLESGKELQISVKSGNGWNLKLGNTETTVAYKLTAGSTEYKTDNAVVLAVPNAKSGDKLASKSVTLGLDAEEALVAGTYTDRLTFTVAVGDQTTVENSVQE